MLQYTFTGPGSPRLDAFVLQHCPGLPRGALHKYLRQNKIKLNGKKAPLATRLQSGDEVRLYLPAVAAEPPALPRAAILFEDEGLLCVNKPAGLISTTGTEDDERDADSLLARARRYLAQEGTAVGSFAPALCHRLDTGTSGVLLVAKTPAVLEWVTGLLREGALHKSYLAATFGHPQPPAGELGGWLQKDAKGGTVHIQPHRAPGAKPVCTRYRTLATSGPLALVEAQLITGRTHQIRAHFAGLGTPILGDSKYGDNAANRRWRCRYQCLCAVRAAFPNAAEGPAEMRRYAGLVVAAPEPWFAPPLREGTFGCDT